MTSDRHLNTPNPSKYLALIPAAGVGARMAAICPKQYLHINDKSILQHTVDAFLKVEQVAHVFVVVSESDAYINQALTADPRVTVSYCGGETRSASVRNGLTEIAKTFDKHSWILVHDAARPGISPALIQKLIVQVNPESVGGLLALPVADTVKRRFLEDGAEKVKTVPRTGLWLAQTPQMFRLNVLAQALDLAQQQQIEITDDASAIEHMGHSPLLIEGHWSNSKITRPDDLALIETWLSHHTLDQ